MTVTAVQQHPETLTMTLEAEFDASAERVWQLWADPRQLERWWGPPTYPATVDAHDLRSGGRVEYHMTGPEGDQPRGYWEIDRADAPHSLVFPSAEAMEKLLAMGMEEGLTQAIGQIDAILAEDAAPGPDRAPNGPAGQTGDPDAFAARLREVLAAGA